MPYVKRILSWLALITLFLGPTAAKAQTPAPPISLRVNYSEVAEGSEALTLGITFTLINDATGRAIPDAQIQSAQVTLLDTSTKAEAKVKKPSSAFYIMLVLDASGSMQPAAEAVRAAATAALENPPDNARFSVIQFDDQITTLQGFTDDREDTAAAIAKFKPAYKGTCLYDAAYAAIDALDQQPPGRRAVILFTDGKDETGAGGLCSKHTYDEVVDLATRYDMRVPINTIGLSGPQSAINATELNNMASTTGGFAAVGSQANIGEAFKEIMGALNAQWLAEATLYPTQGKHDAVLQVTLQDGVTVSAAVNFESSRAYSKPPDPVQVRVDGLEFKLSEKKYLLHLSFVSPQLIGQLKVGLWDDDAGVQVTENSYGQLASPATFEFSAADLPAGRNYTLRISPYDVQGAPILDTDGKPLVIEHEFKYDPTIATTEISIASVTLDGTDAIVQVQTKGNAQIGGFKGWLKNEDTNTKVIGSDFSATSLGEGSTLHISMSAIPAGKYSVELTALGQDQKLLSSAEYTGLVYTPPAAPSGFSVLIGKITAGLKAHPWILSAIVVVVLGFVGGLLLMVLRGRQTGTPVLQGNLEAVLKSDKGKSAEAALDKTMYVGGQQMPSPTPSKARADLKTPLPMLRVLATPCRENLGRIFMLDHFPYVIGRKDGDLNFTEDLKMSRKHAQILFEASSNAYYVVDLQSSNGVMVNGARIAAGQPARLAPGATIGFGPDTQVVFQQS